MYLICHVTLHDHLIERPCEFMGRSSVQDHHPDKPCDHKPCDSGDMSLICL